jgi:DNA-binding LacI/PurR family transcriptional regulator
VDAEQIDAAAQPFDTGRVIGVILIGQWRQHDQLNQLAARHVPIVVWGAQLPQQLYTTVGGDNVSGGMLATAHLIDKGCKRIAFFGDINLPEVAQRYRGYCNALAEHGLPVDPQLRVSVSFLPEGGTEAVEELARRSVNYDAVFACSDLLAMTAINTLREHGKQVPRDISVVGYDDIELSTYFHPPLTTIRQPIREAGQALVSALLALVDGQALASEQLPTELIVRSTVTA